MTDDLRKATHYANSSTAIIELSYSNDVTIPDQSNAEVEVGLDNGSVVTIGPGAATSFTEVSAGLIQVDTGTTFNNVQNVSVEAGFEDAAGNDVSDDDFDVTFAPSVVKVNDDSTFEAFSGENVALENASADSTFDIDGPGVSRTRGTGTNSLVYVLDTDDFENGDYNITNDADVTSVLEISDLGLDVEVDEDEFTTNDAVTATVTSDAINREITADLLDDDGDVVDTVETSIDSDGEVAVDFGTVEDTGTYTVEVTDDNSAVSVESGDFEVTEAPEGDISFEETFITEERGDNANITINFQGDVETANLTIGDQEEVGYEANVSVDSGGEDSVTVGFNTYVAGNTSTLNNADLVYIADGDSDAEITSVDESPDNLTNILETGTYPFEVSDTSFDEIANGNSDAVGDLELEERSVDSFNLWTTSADVYEDVEDVEDISNGVENDTVVETDSLTEGDVLIHELSATGLEGAIEANGGSLADLITDTSSANDSTGIDLRIRQTADSTAPNSERKQVDVQQMIADGNVDIISTEGSYYIAFEESNIVLDDSSRSISDEDAFDVRLRVKDERLLDPDEDELEDSDVDITDFYETATVSFEYVEATGEFDTPVEVQAAEDQTITGTTNAAPGQEFTVRVRSDSDVSPGFVQTSEDVTVQSDGSFEATGLDLSEASVNDTFTVTAQQATFDAEEDGTVVETVGEAAFLEVSDLEPAEATATAGDSVTVSATIENTGEQEATQNIALTLDGDELDTTEVTLAGGNSTTVEFTADTTGLDAGDYEHGIASDDDEATGTLTIEEDTSGDDSSGDDSSGDDSSGDDSSGDDSSGDDSSGDDSSGDDSSGDDSSGDDSSGDDSTDGSTPGFGALVALVALIAAALLATRRND
ncbi:PGF-CTERM protein [Halorubrum xinjiangense]|uniref:PGF-CTERM protein n=1 Tax=Halorubrum xinjiangense TaxID=261291 RepID=A0A1G7HTB4_9EURY|nr:PGF-CTERM protein [Halorubrum xinjiangense]